MKQEISVGIILIKENPLKFLLMKRRDNNIWDFPKGHIHKNETFENCILRELKEETQISNVTFFKNFKEEFTFINPKGSFRKIILFLGKTNDKVVLSNENTSFKWCSFKEANELVKFKEKKEILNKVMNYFENSYLLR